MATILLGIGLACAFEGLVFALAPRRLEEALAALQRLPIDARRLMGLVFLAGGVAMVWLARLFGA
ncbi:DUF2065 domain-containing protein [Mesobaculum littorinae]|uniref:DUF2065 domain-containing protein n=1 Tax=Mesobaculum littorinae TaxID=2486419 RepID=A0A438AJ16_9RHOB|nr:DUF2065 domain-containing protein [Mesobaculum littorinae]RVV98605.1 DUF2065 domain-containing protein [Mesobaculum littorinae]